MSDAPQVPPVDAESPRTPWEPTESGAIPFVHLHTHSHYSLLDGVGKLDALLARAKELEMPALALTDHGNLYGALEFYQKALDVGVKPILGYEAYVAPISRFDKTEKRSYHLTLLATNRKGYENLLVLSSLAYTEGFYYKPRIDRDLLKKHSEGLICLSGCLAGEIARTLANGNGSPESYAKARDAALWHRELFGDRYYLELQDHGIAEQKIALQGTLRLSQELGIPTVISNDVHYVRREDSDAQDLVLCVNTGKFRTDPNRMRMDSDEFYLKSGAEMMERAAGGKGKVDALDKMEADARELSEKLSELMERHKTAPSEQLERKIVAAANRIHAKQEQAAAFSERIRHLNRRKAAHLELLPPDACIICRFFHPVKHFEDQITLF